MKGSRIRRPVPPPEEEFFEKLRVYLVVFVVFFVFCSISFSRPTLILSVGSFDL